MKTSLVFLVIATLLISCNKHECPEQEIPRWEYNYWGYFNGTVNDMQYDHINTSLPVFDRKVEGNVQIIYDQHTTRFVNISINEKTHMHIAVANMVIGLRDMKFGHWNGIRKEDSAVYIEVMGDDNIKRYYTPSEENPLKLDVLNVVWSPIDLPYIDANIKGVLYAVDNPNDIITVDINFGV